MIIRLLGKIRNSFVHASKNHLGSYVVKKINKKKEPYQLHYPNDVADLKRILLPGDVLLVEGETGLSDWIKIFSTHTWSHCALFVGNQFLFAATKPKNFVEAKPNLVEAIITRGIILSNIDKYKNCNLRVCRPKNLTRKDRETVIRFALDKVGLPYDQENIYRFMSLPFNEKSRPTDDIGASKAGRYTCSSLIATAFRQIGLDVLHFYDKETKKLVPYHTSQIQPKDFDLSPNFEIINIYPSTSKKPMGFLRNLFPKQKSA